MIITSRTVQRIIIFHLLALIAIIFSISQFNLPYSVTYLLDAFVIIEFLFARRKIKTVFRLSKGLYVLRYFLLFIVFLIFLQLFNFVPINLSLKAFRRILRFFLFYFSCSCLVDKERIDSTMKMLCKLQILNFILTLYQRFSLNYLPDNAGGIFGTAKGVNGYSNIYFCVICIFIISEYLSKKTNFNAVFSIVGSSLLLSALIELKFFFIEIIAIVVFAIFLSNPSKRTILFMAFFSVGIILSLKLLAKYFPEHFLILLNRDLFIEYTTGTTLGYNISRLNAFNEINSLFFDNNILKELFGLGFGNCDSGSAFYNRYSSYHYTWFTHQLTYLETGHIGLALHLLFFFLVFFHATKNKGRFNENKHYFLMTQISCVVCTMCFFYNQSIQTECAYLIYYLLSFPVIIMKNSSFNLKLKRNN